MTSRRATLMAFFVAAAACTNPSPQSSVTMPGKPAGTPGEALANTPARSEPAHQIAVPADFWVKCSRRGGEPGMWQVTELAGPECRQQCVALNPDELSRMVAAFQHYQFDRITTHPVQASPHRGGVCLEARWNGRAHDVCDVAVTEVEQHWRHDFDALTGEVLEIFLAARVRAQQQEASLAEPPGKDASAELPLDGYLRFLRSRDGFKGAVVRAYFREDLDHDGCPEAVVATSDVAGDNSPISGLYVLRDCNGKLRQIGENLAEQAYWGTKVELVRLKKMPGKYILYRLENDGSMEGFDLSGVRGNSIEKIAHAASPTGSGTDRLVDSDKDGVYDGFIRYRAAPWAKDVSVWEHYELVNGDFQRDRAGIDGDLPPYPETARGVLEQYFVLSDLAQTYELKLPSVSKRVRKLFPQSMNASMNRDIARAYVQAMGESEPVKFAEKQGPTHAFARVSFPETSAPTRELQCRLSKNKGRWQIVSLGPAPKDGAK